MDNINKHDIAPLQAEKQEYFLTPEGNLVQSKATKKHVNMDGTDITDYQPEGSYVFSNDKSMTLSKKDAKEIVYGREYLNYVEGQQTKIPKNLDMSTFVNGDKSTFAEIAKKIANKYKVLHDDVHMDNPFIKRANTLNKETRMKPLSILMQLNEAKRPRTYEEILQEQQAQQEAQQPLIKNEEPVEQPQFKYGGYHGKKKWGGFLTGAASGAGAGAVLGPWGIVGGALIGGLGSMFIGNEKDREARKRELERAAVFQKNKNLIENSYSGNNMATFAKAAIPLPKYHNLNLDSNIDRTNSTYDRILMGRNAEMQRMLSSNNKNISTAADAMIAQGADPTQVNNYLAAVQGNTINANNQMASQINDRYNQYDLNKANTLNAYDEALAKDTQYGLNLFENNKYNKYQNVVGEFGSNYQNYNKDLRQHNMDDYTTKQALALGAAAEKQNAQAAFGAGLQTVGAGISNYQNMEMQKELMNSYLAGGSVTAPQALPPTVPSTQAVPTMPGVTPVAPRSANPELQSQYFNMINPGFSPTLGDVSTTGANLSTGADGNIYYTAPGNSIPQRVYTAPNGAKYIFGANNVMIRIG